MRRIEGSKVYRVLYPVVPAVVAAWWAGGIAAMPVATLVSLSDEPAMVGFSSLPSHATCRAVIDAGRFSVSWLDRRYAGSVVSLGTHTGSTGGDKLKRAGLHARPGETLGTPVVEEASATLECRFNAAIKMGDHYLVVGDVVRAEASEDFGEYWAFKNYDPMLYGGLGRAIGRFSASSAVRRPSSRGT